MNMQTAIAPAGAISPIAALTRRPVAARGTHDLIDDDHAYPALPDLTTGRTIYDALRQLGDVLLTDRRAYAAEWHAELIDIGCTVSVHIADKGDRALSLSTPCDAQERLRAQRRNELIEHLNSVPGGRRSLIQHLISEGRFVDDRRSSTKALFQALRVYLSAGFRIMLDPEGRLRTGPMPRDFWKGDPTTVASINDAGQAFRNELARWRNHDRLARAVQILGVPSEVAGWKILERVLG